MTGELLADRFVVLREVGSGGTSTVYIGRDEVLDRPVAVKILNRDSSGRSAASRFQRAGLDAAKLSHPNVAQVYDAGGDTLNGRRISYVVMEYLSGGSLADLARVRGRLTEVMLSRIGGDLASGLAHAHERGIIHNGVRPENILFDAQGTPKLTDFGATPNSKQSYHSEPYASPEQLQGRKTTPKTDVYSLGVTLYAAATGAFPFSGEDRSDSPIRPREQGAAIGETYEAAILSCLAENPDERPDAVTLHARLLGRDVPDTGPSLVRRAGTALKAAGAVGAAGVSRAAYSAREAGTTLRNSIGERNSGDGGMQTVFVQSRSFGAGLDRRRVLIAAAALALLLALAAISIYALSSRGGDTAENSGGEAARKTPGEEAKKSGGSTGGETSVEESVPEETEPAPPVDTADDVVFDMYVKATENDFEGSWNLLSSRYQEEEVGSLEEWEARQIPLTGLVVTEEFAAQPAGENEAEVTFQTQETRDGVVQNVSGIWTVINEDGEWRLDSFQER